LTLPSAYVSENDEEDDSQSSQEEKKTGKKKFITLAYFSQLINKRIFSDNFDKSNSTENFNSHPKKKFGGSMSMLDQPIKEDSEFEEADNYMSDSSSSSHFSLRKRYLSLDLAKLVDKLEPLDN